MGRPPIGKTAMTGAQRVARHRAKTNPKRWCYAASLDELRETLIREAVLKARLREAEAELASERGTDIPDWNVESAIADLDPAWLRRWLGEEEAHGLFAMLGFPLEDEEGRRPRPTVRPGR
jgi:hypothetical protein